MVRRMPARVRLTSDEVVGVGRSALCACDMTTSRRAIVAAFAPRSASEARKAATVWSVAGSGSAPCSWKKWRKSRQPAACAPNGAPR
jgi:hypothetical protein